MCAAHQLDGAHSFRPLFLSPLLLMSTPSRARTRHSPHRTTRSTRQRTAAAAHEPTHAPATALEHAFFHEEHDSSDTSSHAQLAPHPTSATAPAAAASTSMPISTSASTARARALPTAVLSLLLAYTDVKTVLRCRTVAHAWRRATEEAGEQRHSCRQAQMWCTHADGWSGDVAWRQVLLGVFVATWSGLALTFECDSESYPGALSACIASLRHIHHISIQRACDARIPIDRQQLVMAFTTWTRLKKLSIKHTA